MTPSFEEWQKDFLERFPYRGAANDNQETVQGQIDELQDGIAKLKGMVEEERAERKEDRKAIEKDVVWSILSSELFLVFLFILWRLSR